MKKRSYKNENIYKVKESCLLSYFKIKKKNLRCLTRKSVFSETISPLLYCTLLQCPVSPLFYFPLLVVTLFMYTSKCLSKNPNRRRRLSSEKITTVKQQEVQKKKEKKKKTLFIFCQLHKR